MSPMSADLKKQERREFNAIVCAPSPRDGERLSRAERDAITDAEADAKVPALNRHFARWDRVEREVEVEK